MARDQVRCGFIGLGDQGAPMARRMLDAGYPLMVWARRADTLAPWAGTGASLSASIAQLGASVDHVGICVVDDAGVQEVCAQLIPAMAPRGRIIIHSTISPATCKKLARDAALRDLQLLDAPVSGGGALAAAGRLTVMYGGEEPAASEVRPIFETFGALVVHVGSVGAGQSVKLLNNALFAANMGLVHEAVAAGEQLGIRRDALLEVLKASSGRSYGLEAYAQFKQLLDWQHGARLIDKDIGLLGESLSPDGGAFEALRSASAPLLANVRNQAANAAGVEQIHQS